MIDSKKFRESKKFIFGTLALICNMLTLTFIIVMMCMFPTLSSAIVSVAAIFIPASNALYALLIGSQGAVDYSASKHVTQKED